MMKRFITIILAILMISALFCVMAYAEDGEKDPGYVDDLPAPDADTVIRVAGLNKSGKLVLISDDSELTFTADNVFGDEVTFKNKDEVTFLTEESDLVGSIFGEGSFSVIVSIVALCISVGTLFVFYAEKKKNKGLPDEEEKSPTADHA